MIAKWVITKRGSNAVSPAVQGKNEFMLGFVYGEIEFIFSDMFSGINAIISEYAMAVFNVDDFK